MAQKKHRRAKWLRNLFLFLFTPVLVWILAFVVWFFWRDIARLFDKNRAVKTPPGVSRSPERLEPRRENRSQEKIPEEDRRKLDEILKSR